MLLSSTKSSDSPSSMKGNGEHKYTSRFASFNLSYSLSSLQLFDLAAVHNDKIGSIGRIPVHIPSQHQ